MSEKGIIRPVKIEEFERLVSRLRKGLKVGDLRILCREPKRGRFAQEFNLDIFAQNGGSAEPLLHVKVFLGRGHYRDWVEIFGISGEVFGESYFGSEVESAILDELCSITGRVFVEYFDDMETVRELSLGVPPALSRLGFELAKRGFTWFKDWYFPEGLMEGGHKLQAEKPADERAVLRHLKELEREFEGFLRSVEDVNLTRSIRGRFKILQSLWNRTS